MVPLCTFDLKRPTQFVHLIFQEGKTVMKTDRSGSLYSFTSERTSEEIEVIARRIAVLDYRLSMLEKDVPPTVQATPKRGTSSGRPSDRPSRSSLARRGLD